MEIPETRYAVTADGAHIAYQVFGDGPIDVVVLQGLSHVERGWELPALRRFFERLSGFARVLIHDRRGFGASDPLPTSEPPNLEALDDDFVTLLDATGFGRAAVIGMTNGGFRAITFATRHPERCAALAVLDASARFAAAPDYPAGFSSADVEAIVQESLAGWRDGSTSQLGTTDADLLRRYARFRRDAVGIGPLERNIRWLYALDLRSEVARITAPTLVVHSTHGVVPLAQGSWLAEHIAESRLVVVDRVGRLGTDVRDGDLLADPVERFLTGTTNAAPTRRLVTLLFSDIVGSTARGASAGDRIWTDLMGRHDELVRATIDHEDGRVVKTLGDGFLATFTSPTAAVRCGRAIVDRCRSLGVEERVGIHAGEVEDLGDDIAGITVALARRVCDLAGSGEVLVSETMHGLLLGSDVVLDDRGTHELKGVPGTWRLFAVGP